MKHLKHMLSTYVYSHCNICNIMMKHIQYNIRMKYMQHPDETYEIYI
jgi:hypothetical protein